MTHCSPGAAPVQDELARRRAASLAALKARIERGLEAGELPADTDAHELASFYMTVFEGMSVQARDNATEKTLLAVARRAMLAWPE